MMDSNTTAKQGGQSDNPGSRRSDQRRNNENGRSKTENATHLAKISTEDEHLLAALDRIREGAAIDSEDVSDRIVCQAGGAMLGYWQPKTKSVEEKIVTAANALAEMQPTNATELMLAAQMLAANDAVFLFMSHATSDNASLEERNFSTEKACRFMNYTVGAWRPPIGAVMPPEPTFDLW
jgi:hypothetical protein